MTEETPPAIPAGVDRLILGTELSNNAQSIDTIFRTFQHAHDKLATRTPLQLCQDLRTELNAPQQGNSMFKTPNFQINKESGQNFNKTVHHLWNRIHMDLDIYTRRNFSAATNTFTDLDIPYFQPLWLSTSQNRAIYEIQFPFIARFSPNDPWSSEVRSVTLRKWQTAMGTYQVYGHHKNFTLYKYGAHNSIREEALRLIMWVGFAKTIQVAFPFPDIRPLDAIRFCFVNVNDVGNDVTYSRHANTLRTMSYPDIVKENLADKVSGRLATGSHMNILQHVWNGGYSTSFATSLQYPLLQQTNQAIENLLRLYVEIATDIKANAYVVDKYHYQITPPPRRKPRNMHTTFYSIGLR